MPNPSISERYLKYYLNGPGGALDSADQIEAVGENLVMYTKFRNALREDLQGLGIDPSNLTDEQQLGAILRAGANLKGVSEDEYSYIEGMTNRLGTDSSIFNIDNEELDFSIDRDDPSVSPASADPFRMQDAMTADALGLGKALYNKDDYFTEALRARRMANELGIPSMVADYKNKVRRENYKPIEAEASQLRQEVFDEQNALLDRPPLTQSTYDTMGVAQSPSSMDQNANIRDELISAGALPEAPVQAMPEFTLPTAVATNTTTFGDMYRDMSDVGMTISPSPGQTMPSIVDTTKEFDQSQFISPGAGGAMFGSFNSMFGGY